MTPHGAARQYANALFDVATRSGITDRVQRELTALEQVIAGHGELARVFESPAIPAARKRAMADALLAASGDVTGEIQRFVGLLADRDRLALLADVLGAFNERVMAAAQIVRADVTTAVPLGDEARAALVAALSKASGRRVSVTEHVDPSVIGGVVAKVGSVVFDGSVTRQLERLRERLLAEA